MNGQQAPRSHITPQFIQEDSANPTYPNHFRLDERNCFGKFSFLLYLKLEGGMR